MTPVSFAPAWRWGGRLWAASMLPLLLLAALDAWYWTSEAGRLDLEYSRTAPVLPSFLVAALQGAVAAVAAVPLLVLSWRRGDERAARASREALLWPALGLLLTAALYAGMRGHFEAHLGDDCDHGDLWSLAFLPAQSLCLLLSPFTAWRVRRALRMELSAPLVR